MNYEAKIENGNGKNNYEKNILPYNSINNERDYDC